MPIGYWEKGNLSNIGFNHWGIDATAAMTWLDPELGAELSVPLGLTFNFENPDTDYKSGTELHAEFAATKIMSQQFSFGLVGYYYDQITGDSGKGAKLGDFKGHVLGYWSGLELHVHGRTDPHRHQSAGTSMSSMSRTDCPAMHSFLS